jgi:hypothetical protein
VVRISFDLPVLMNQWNSVVRDFAPALPPHAGFWQEGRPPPTPHAGKPKPKRAMLDIYTDFAITDAAISNPRQNPTPKNSPAPTSPIPSKP